MKTLLVWFLYIANTNGSNPQLYQFGPYADKQSCEAVAAIQPFLYVVKDCVPVRIPRKS